MTAEQNDTVDQAAVVRPWGTWRVLAEEPGYKVKRLEVAPGLRLSYQSHHHRSEHWYVVSGVARFVIDDVIGRLLPGDSVDVPCGAKHRLANPGTEPLVVIEVQLGDYTGEDDIVRHHDDFSRAQ